MRKMFRSKSWAVISLASLGVGGFLGRSWERSRNGEFPYADDGTFKFDAFKFFVPSVQASMQLTSPPGNVVPVAKGVELGPGRVSTIMKYGFPSMENVRSFDDFVLAYDKRNRVPHWVFEHLTADLVKDKGDINRENSEFKEDESIHPYFRATNEDFRGSGYDRGHLAAAANHRWSQKTMDQTFILTNMAPQVGKGFNRDAWNTLEKFVRHLTKTFPNVYVCSGPLYLPRREGDGKLYVKYEVIGKNHVAVPTHFFKVVVCQSSSGEYELLSFVMPNQVLPEKVNLKNYLVPVETIERAAGLLLFDKIPRNRFKKINGKSL